MKSQANGINIFNQFGFKETHSSGVHVIGNCPFCGREDHFYLNVNSVNKSWDCKSCLRYGGFKTFLEQITEFCIEQFTLQNAKLLMDKYELEYNTFSELFIGFHPFTKQYVIPVLNIQREVVGMKLSDLQVKRNAAGCSSYLYGQWVSDFSKCKNIFITEGESDSWAWYEICKKLKLTDISGFGWLGVPGAGYKFKQDDVNLLMGKNLYLLYDNDEAGFKGRDKTIEMFKNHTKNIFIIKWTEGVEEGMDLRKIYNMLKSADETYKFIEENLVEAKIQNTSINRDYGPIIPCKEVYSVFKKHLHLPDLTLLDVIFGTVLANRIPGDPVWMFIVAPPGATKTEPILSLTGNFEIEVLDTLTTSTLISGAILVMEMILL